VLAFFAYVRPFSMRPSYRPHYASCPAVSPSVCLLVCVYVSVHTYWSGEFKPLEILAH